MFMVIGTTLNEQGTVDKVRLMDTETMKPFLASWGQFCQACQANFDFGNVNREKFAPNEGWGRYESYSPQGARVSGPALVVLPFPDDNGQFHVVDGNANMQTFANPIDLIAFAEKNDIANWYGYSVTKARTVLYGEQLSTSEFVLGYKNNSASKASKVKPEKEKRAVSKLPKSKEQKDKEAKKSEGTNFRSRGMGDYETVQRFTSETAQYNMSGKSLGNAALADMNKPDPNNFIPGFAAQFPMGVVRFDSPKKNTHFELIGHQDELTDSPLFGIEIVYDKTDEAEGETDRWTVVPERYRHINVLPNGIAFCMKPDGEMSLFNIKKSEEITKVSNKPIRDYLMVATASKNQFLVGAANEPGVTCYWSVMGKDLQPTKEIACKMALDSQIFSKNRIYKGTLGFAEFIDRNGMGVIMSLKDYSYDSRMTFGPKTRITSDPIETAVPTTATLNFDMTSGKVTLDTDLGTTSIVGTYTNVSNGALKYFDTLIDSVHTLPIDEELKIRRHTEVHKTCKYVSIPYEKASALAGILQMFEDCTDLDSLTAYLFISGHKTLDSVIKEFDPTNFMQICDGDATKGSEPITFLGKFLGLDLSQYNAGQAGQVYGFFRRTGTGISMVCTKLFEGGITSDEQKITTKTDNIADLISLVASQGVQTKVYDLTITNTLPVGEQPDVPLKQGAIPAYIRDKYAKVGTNLYDAKTHLRVIGLNLAVNGRATTFMYYIGISDGLEFNYNRNLKDIGDNEGKSTAEIASLHSKVFDANKPILSSKLVSVFTIEVA